MTESLKFTGPELHNLLMAITSRKDLLEQLLSNSSIDADRRAELVSTASRVDVLYSKILTAAGKL